MSRRFKHWTAAEDAVVIARYHLDPPWAIAALLGRTERGVVDRAQRHLALNVRAGHGLYSFQEVAKALGVTAQRVHDYERKGLVRAVGRKTHRLVTRDELERLTTILCRKKPVPGWVPLAEAERRLGYSRCTLDRLCRLRCLRSYKASGQWFVDSSHVAELEARLRNSGETSLSWKGVSPEMDAFIEQQTLQARLAYRKRKEKARA